MTRSPFTAILAIVLLALTIATGATSPASAADGQGRIAHVEAGDGSLQILVDIPAGVQPDLSRTTVTVDGITTTATAAPADGTTSVRRTAILVIDLSNSMRGARFAAALDAARLFITNVPDDVYVGIVGFAGEVTTLLDPSLDRSDAQRMLQDVSLSRNTSLYDGVVAAADLAGTEGQRTLLVISDGADTTDTTLDDAVAAISDADLTVDVVSLDQGGTIVPGLQELADAGDGTVISADPDALTQAFADEATVLANQVLVTAALPDSVINAGSTEGDVKVSIATADGAVVAEAFSPFGTATASSLPGLPTPRRGTSVPSWLQYAGPLVLGLGLLVVVVLLVPRKAVPLTPGERVTTYTGVVRANDAATTPRVEADQALAQVKDVAADLLQRNQSLEAKISKRLEAAGSELRSAEWVLVHGGVFVATGLLGLLLSRGNVVVGLIFMMLGFFGPWLYLGSRRNRRRKAFNRALPDTLQLMSGALAAGLSLAQSVDTIVREGPEPIASEFKRVLVETRLGVALEDALDGVSERFESKDFEWVVMAIRIQRQVGGNLAELLDTVGGTMREREYIRRQVSALAAEGKLSAYVLGGLPPGFLLYLVLTNRDYVGVLFTEPLGWAMLTGAAMLLSLGAFWMSRLIKVEI